mmetsp:Transcript_116776/g.362852  ORF Transcript_116776/g.362852 Transcript_116776/m.362852 type:complete len:90 (+) Transcript_116776:128-397(+)
MQKVTLGLVPTQITMMEEAFETWPLAATVLRQPNRPPFRMQGITLMESQKARFERTAVHAADGSRPADPPSAALGLAAWGMPCPLYQVQ